MSVKATNGVRNLFMVDSWSLLVLFSVHVVSKVKLYQIIQENVGQEVMIRSVLNRNNQHWRTRRYGTGSGSDRAPPERALSKAPGRSRSRYRINVACFDLASYADRRTKMARRKNLWVVGFRSRFVVDRRLNYFFTTIRVALYSSG